MNEKHTKNKFKKDVKDMNQDKLIKKLSELNLKMIKGRFKIAQQGNPYEGGEYPMKLMKWMKCIISQELHIRTINRG